jgi:hypothetical protein
MRAFNATLFAPLAPWGGFKVCAAVQDCILNNGTEYDHVLDCSKVMGSPDLTAKYCRCDLAMGGAFCDEFNSTTNLKVRE